MSSKNRAASSEEKQKLRELIEAAGDDLSGEGASFQKVGDDWIAIMKWPDDVTDGGPAQLIIKPIGKMPVGGLSSTVLRQIDFRSAIEMHRDQAAESARHNRVDPEAMRAFERKQLRSALSEGVTKTYLAMLAFEYARAVDRGQSNINDYLSELVGKPVGTVRGHVIRARKEGLLTGSHGKKGGSLSPEADDLCEPYAMAWLDELDKLAGNTTAEGEPLVIETPELPIVVEDTPQKPKRRRPQKAISSSAKT